MPHGTALHAAQRLRRGLLQQRVEGAQAPDDLHLDAGQQRRAPALAHIFVILLKMGPYFCDFT